MKAVDVFLKLVDASYWWLSRQMPSKVRDGTVETKPGDMIKKLSPEEEFLENCKRYCSSRQPVVLKK
jgi:hypothetical protein